MIKKAMKDEQYTDIICKEFCKFYKEEGKEEIHCGGYELLRNNITPGELRLLSRYIHKAPFAEHLEDALTEFVCSKCDFRIDGCDFRDGLAEPPCGGYIMMSRLLKYFKDME